MTTRDLNTEAQESLLKRLRRIEGQVRGLHKMVEEGRSCDEVMTQMDATRKAMASASTALLQEFLSVYATQLTKDKNGTAEEIAVLLRRFAS